MNILEEKTNIFNNFDLMFTEGISSEKIEHFLILSKKFV